MINLKQWRCAQLNKIDARIVFHSIQQGCNIQENRHCHHYFFYFVGEETEPKLRDIYLAVRAPQLSSRDLSQIQLL